MFSGDKLKAYRKAKKMRQRDMAKILNVNRCTVNRWETEIYSPRVKDLIRIAQVLDIQPEELL